MNKSEFFRRRALIRKFAKKRSEGHKLMNESGTDQWVAKRHIFNRSLETPCVFCGLRSIHFADDKVRRAITFRSTTGERSKLGDFVLRGASMAEIDEELARLTPMCDPCYRRGGPSDRRKRQLARAVLPR